MFYSATRVRQMRDKYLLFAKRSLILMCDTLRYYSYVARSTLAEQDAKNKSERETSELARMLHKTGLSDIPGCRIARFSEYLADPDFQKFLSAFNVICLTQNDVQQHLTKLAEELVTKFYPTATEETFFWQSRYIAEETAISVYCTEVEQYSNELYVRQEGMLVSYLYERHSDLMRVALGKETLSRKFIALEHAL